MKRQIKFRAKRNDQEKPGQWAFGDLTHTLKITELVDVPCVRVAGCDIDPITIGQYLGIDDKDGKEIYEGDILRLDHLHSGADGKQLHCWCEGVVYFDADYHALFVNLINAEPPMSKAVSAMYMAFAPDTQEVIGNIHDNPDKVQAMLQRAKRIQEEMKAAQQQPKGGRAKGTKARRWPWKK